MCGGLSEDIFHNGRPNFKHVELNEKNAQSVIPNLDIRKILAAFANVAPKVTKLVENSTRQTVNL